MVDTVQPNLLAVVVVFPVLSTIFVALRVGFRSYSRHFKSDDALCVAAWALAVANAGTVYKFIQVQHIGYHYWDFPTPTPEDHVLGSKYGFAQQLLYNPILGLVKASILVFLLRLGDQRKLIKYSLHALFYINLGHLIGTFVGALTQCLPVHMYWGRRDMNNKTEFSCFDEETFSIATAVIAIITDVLILLIPIFMVWPLRMNRRKKVAVGCVLSLGWIVVIVACVRLKLFFDLWAGAGRDYTYTTGTGVVISIVEVNVAIILSCGPALNALLTRLAPRILGSKNSKPGGYVYTNDYNMPSRQPRRFDLPSLASSRNSGRPYRTLDDDRDCSSQDEIMNNDGLGTKRAEIIANMINKENKGQGLYR
ncbi:hypothetical protein Q7P37_006037 [Cladosporium fusiforme]